MHLAVMSPSIFLHLSQARSRHVFSLWNKYCDRLCCGKLPLMCVCVRMQHVHIRPSGFVSFFGFTLLDVRVYFWTARVQIILSTLLRKATFFLAPHCTPKVHLA